MFRTVYHTQQETSPGKWETRAIDETPTEGFASMVDHISPTEPEKFRTVMAEQKGTEVKRAILVTLSRRSAYYLARCAVGECVRHAHFDDVHWGPGGAPWREAVALVSIDTPYRVG